MKVFLSMWSPSHVKDIIKLERVQRQAAKFILNDYVSPYHERCTALFILPLCFRRERIDLCFLYSYFHGKLSVVIRDASGLHIFRKNLNELYLTMVNLFDVNNRCTLSLACACVNCRM